MPNGRSDNDPRQRAAFAWAAVAGLACCLLGNRAAAFYEQGRSMGKGIEKVSQGLFDFLGQPLVFSTSAAALCVALICGMAAFGLVLSYMSRGTFRHGEEHGSARFATREEIRRYGDWDLPMANIVLSKEVLMRTRDGSDFEHNRNRNVLVVGGSGAGKTRCYVKPNLMQVPHPDNLPGKGKTRQDMEASARSFLVTDPKGKTREETAHMMLEAGYALKEFNVVDWSSSMHYNPLSYIRSEEDVPSLITCIIRNTTPDKSAPSDPFWENAERKLLEALLYYIVSELPPASRNLPVLCDLLDLATYDERNPGMSALDILFYEVESGRRYAGAPVRETVSEEDLFSGEVERDDERCWVKVREPRPHHPGVRSYNDVMSGAPETIQSIIISCKVRLGPLRPARVREKLSRDDMELDRFGERKTILYAVPHDQDPTYNFLLALLAWQMLKVLSDKALTRPKGSLATGVDLILDEAANFYIPDLEKTVATCRSRNIGLTLIYQSLAQLKSRYDDDAATIMGNCDSKVFLGSTDNETNKELEEMIGQQTVTTENPSESRGANYGTSKQTAQHARALMQASEIARMPRKECLVLIAYARPFRGAKYDPARHPMYRHIDPGHKGALHARGFDMGAYLRDPAYLEERDALVDVRCAPTLVEGYVLRERDGEVLPEPSIALRWIVEADVRGGGGRAWNFHGNLSVSAGVEPPSGKETPEDRAARAALAEDEARAAREGAKGAECAVWTPRRPISDLGSLDGEGLDPGIQLDVYSLNSVLEPREIEPGKTARYLVGVQIGVAEIEAALGRAERKGGSAVFAVRLSGELRCANADLPNAGAIDTEARVRVSLSDAGLEAALEESPALGRFPDYFGRASIEAE